MEVPMFRISVKFTLDEAAPEVVTAAMVRSRCSALRCRCETLSSRRIEFVEDEERGDEPLLAMPHAYSEQAFLETTDADA